MEFSFTESVRLVMSRKSKFSHTMHFFGKKLFTLQPCLFICSGAFLENARNAPTREIVNLPEDVEAPSEPRRHVRPMRYRPAKYAIPKGPINCDFDLDECEYIQVRHWISLLEQNTLRDANITQRKRLFTRKFLSTFLNSNPNL